MCLLAIIAVMAVRGGFIVARSTALSDDPDAYRVIAETLSKTGVFGLPVGDANARPTAFRPPLYPWLLSWFVGEDGKLSNSAPAVLNFLLGVIAVGLTWDIARRLVSPRAALVAAGLVLIDPILLWQSTLVMTETIATTLAVMVWWWWVVRICHTPMAESDESCETAKMPVYVNATVLGGLLLLTILCRPTFLVWSVLILPVMWLAGPACRIRRSVFIATAVLVIATGVGTWTIRNMSAVGKPVWGTTHGGYTLLLANNDSFYDYLENKPWQLPWRSEAWEPSEFFAAYEALPRSGDECADDRVAYDAAKSVISKRREMFWYSCWIRLARLWQPFPHATGDRSTASIVVVGLYHSAVYLLILIAIWRLRDWLHPRRWRAWVRWWPAIALVITLSGVHAVYWSNPRMRSPAIPVLAIAASGAFKRRSDQPG
ncbi:glycosyltransferase family 39 protein [Rhodopirellula sp. ICT_H3.1]|uniref:Glycosyltransferase family 39 protein n=2 Tax=Aporhodopirellula aestuarii TaxID=2950107 RepID=A0ABT0U6N2_9BACT|nr:glycosyltransferase family 39 protein [Aporhodopirellula aestuarii]